MSAPYKYGKIPYSGGQTTRATRRRLGMTAFKTVDGGFSLNSRTFGRIDRLCGDHGHQRYLGAPPVAASARAATRMPYLAEA